ncbi:hypothetical protein IPN41_03360 [Candidatus Falkowbacteria bacterium]|nr:MAG: hypothetical protein IPN41_03360 [Candidatus Falkowbacteria bacterium]
MKNFEQTDNEIEIPAAMKEKIDIYKVYNNFKDIEPFYVGACLAGLDTTEAWEVREYLLSHDQNGDGKRGVVQGLAGIRTNKAYQLRNELLVFAPESVARGLAGDDSEEAWAIREKLKSNYLDKPGVKEGLADSLAGLKNERAWQLRDELKDQVLFNVFEGLVGVDDEKSWELRNKYQELMMPSVANSLIGLSGKKVDVLRQEFFTKGEDGDLAVLISYIGDDSPEAWALRNKFIDENSFIVGTSLVGIKNEKADKMRNILLEKINTLQKEEVVNKDKTEKVRKGLLQGLNSNYIFEALKMVKKLKLV